MSTTLKRKFLFQTKKEKALNMYVIGSSFSCSYEKLMIFFFVFLGDYTFHIVTINNEMIISSVFFGIKKKG